MNDDETKVIVPAREVANFAVVEWRVHQAVDDAMDSVADSIVDEVMPQVMDRIIARIRASDEMPVVRPQAVEPPRAGCLGMLLALLPKGR